MVITDDQEQALHEVRAILQNLDAELSTLVATLRAQQYDEIGRCIGCYMPAPCKADCWLDWLLTAHSA